MLIVHEEVKEDPTHYIFLFIFLFDLPRAVPSSV